MTGERHDAPPGAAALLGTAAVVVLIATTIARAFGGTSSLYVAALAAVVVLIITGFRSINQKLRNTAFVLLAMGALVLPFARDPIGAIQRGVFVGGLLLSLTASVMLIARCAVQSYRIQQVGSGLRERRGTPRYLAFTLASQFFSGILGLAGANLMFVMAAPSTESAGATRTETVVAVARGFTAASCWSPVFGNMAILLALYPSLHWAEVFPVGLAIGQLSIVVGMLTSRAASRHDHAQPRADLVRPTSSAELLMIAMPVILVLIGFLFLILFLSQALHIVISAAIVMLGPLVSLLFNAAMGEPGQRMQNGLRGLGSGMLRFPTLASEAILFLSCGCAGSLMADAFPADWIDFIGQQLRGHPFLGLCFLLSAIIAAALAGIHPVLSAVFLASTITPQVLGLPPIAHIAAILAGWGLSTSVTPFSVISLTASRYSGIGLYQISLGRNWAFALCTALIVCGALTGYVWIFA